MIDNTKALKAIAQRLPPLPRSWGMQSVHDANPSNKSAWDKHVRQLAKAKESQPDIAPTKKKRSKDVLPISTKKRKEA